MAVELTPLGKFTLAFGKWVVVPACAALIGYVLIGPRIGGQVVKSISKLKPSAARTEANVAETPVAPPPSEQEKEFQRIRSQRS